MNKDYASVVKGNLEAIDQCISMLNGISAEHYTTVCSPAVSSSIGEHFRHILDIYRSVMLSLGKEKTDVIDYDKRRRGAACETDIAVAQREFAALRSWLLCLDDSLLIKNVEVKTEVSLGETVQVLLSSSVLRELIFVSSHAVHHLAIISTIARLQNIGVDGSVGVAPATASFLRSADVKAV